MAAECCGEFLPLLVIISAGLLDLESTRKLVGEGVSRCGMLPRLPLGDVLSELLSRWCGIGDRAGDRSSATGIGELLSPRSACSTTAAPLAMMVRR